jgi:hypothetical protein
MHAGQLVFILFVAGFWIMGGSKWLGPAIDELFRGGPRPPSHPIPGNDSRFLTRRRSAAAESK